MFSGSGLLGEWRSFIDTTTKHWHRLCLFPCFDNRFLKWDVDLEFCKWQIGDISDSCYFRWSLLVSLWCYDWRISVWSSFNTLSLSQTTHSEVAGMAGATGWMGRWKASPKDWSNSPPWGLELDVHNCRREHVFLLLFLKTQVYKQLWYAAFIVVLMVGLPKFPGSLSRRKKGNTTQIKSSNMLFGKW